MYKLLILFLVLFSTLSHASLITVKFKTGAVLVNKQKWNPKIELKYGDIIETKENGLIILKLEKHSTIKINESSKVTLTPPKKSKRGKLRHKVLLNAGSIFVKAVQKVLKEEKSTLTLQTRIASMGVRGTEFFASYSDSQNLKNKKDIWMCVKEGKVIVQNRRTKNSTTVLAGEGVQVPFGKRTSKPRPLLWTKKLNWSMNPRKGDVANKIDIKQAYYDLLNIDYD